MQNIILNDGNTLPAIGFGVFRIPNDGSTRKAVSEALRAGYRHIDTAAVYGNETEVGEAVRMSGIPRNNLFITSKLWFLNYGYEAARAGIDASLRRLQMDYLDLYLLHQPYGDVLGAWQALEEAQKQGKIKSIGVSNMTPKLWKDFVPKFSTPPAVNQVEYHPFFQQKQLRSLIKEDGVVLEAWSPLGNGDRALLEHPLMIAIARKYHRNTGQIILRFALQEGIVVLPKSVHSDRIAGNINIFDFTLSEDEISAIRCLDTGRGSRDPEDPEREAYLRQHYVMHKN
ncbi:MAG: aldo/keto reductase [Desulfovibrionaceae bacterium]|nr:aldo/keto reductase [Desulfovibrionaceae bacterium]